MQPLKKLFLAFLAIVLSLTANSQAKVIVYTSDFSGMNTELVVGKYDNLKLLQAGIPVVRSVKVPAGMQVTLYEKDNFQGNSLVLLQDANQKLLEGKGFGQIVQRVSLIVEKASDAVLNQPTVTIYKDNFSGASLALRPGYYDHFELGNVGNDNLSAVKVPKGMKVTLYEHGGYQGRSLVLTQDATAPFLIQNKFNDLASSIFVEVLPEPVKEVPVVVQEPTKPADPVIIKEEVIDLSDEGEVVNTMVTLFEGNYSGNSKKLAAGRYTGAAIGIRDNSLSTIVVPQGFNVTLYDQPNFKGRSFIIKGESARAVYLKDFDNVVSSLVIELEPQVMLYADNVTATGVNLTPGYYNVNEFQINNDDLSSVKVAPGMWVLLFEHIDFKGRSLLLTQDASQDFMSGKEFNNVTSSLIVGSKDTPLPVVTLYDGNRTGVLKKLMPGQYPVLDVGNDLLSSIEVPRGLQVTLYDHAGYEGRSMTITQSVTSEFMKHHGFDNVTSSLVIEQRNPEVLFVTLYSDSYRGFAQQLTPGKYLARDITIGDKQLSSLKIPYGMQVQLFVNADLTGATTTLERDTDFTANRLLDNQYASLIVTDVHQPQFGPVAVETPGIPVVEKEDLEEVVEIRTYEEPTVHSETSHPEALEEIKDCTLNDKQYQDALKAIQSKPFKDEKMDMALLVTKDKCLTNEQIRGVAKQFGFEDQTLAFIKHAYDKALEKETYYQLESVFTFSSSKAAFNKFLKEKK